MVHNDKLTSEQLAAKVGLPMTVAQPTLVAYRSVGIGVFGASMRYAGMPLEKIALYMNSSQVSGKGQFGQAVRLAFKEGAMAPYRVVGPASLTAWFLQYSVMGVAFQFFDQTLSNLFGVRQMYYGPELMEKHVPVSSEPFDYQMRAAVKTVLSPVLAACLEASVSNRAEAQRYFGPDKYKQLQQGFKMSAFTKAVGPAFMPNAMRNIIMCQTSFLLTPLTYRIYFPQEHKNKTSLFWYGLGLNMFVGNIFAITQQALWGRSLDYLAQNGKIHYRSVVQQGLAKDGTSAFFTGPKWFSRVLMNAPAQGTLPWFYNEILPLGEELVLTTLKNAVYDPFLDTTPSRTDVLQSMELIPADMASTMLQRTSSQVTALTEAPQPELTANSPRC
jgi:hypothetical protein